MSFEKQIEKMSQMIKDGSTIQEIQKKINPSDFTKLFWIEIYRGSRNKQQKAEALRNLRKIMLVQVYESDDNPLYGRANVIRGFFLF